MQPDEDPIVPPKEFGTQLCAVLGLEPRNVLEIRLEVDGANLPLVHVTMPVRRQAGLQVLELLRTQYRLVYQSHQQLPFKPDDSAAVGT